MRGLGGEGPPPERVLVLVEPLVADAVKAAEPPLHEGAVLRGEVVQWALDAYFSAA